MANLHLYDVLLRPVTTEETQKLMELNQYVFEVALEASKPEIKAAVQEIFDVKVKKVNTVIMPAKRGVRGRHEYWRTKEWKKAIVTLEDGETIEQLNV